MLADWDRLREKNKRENIISKLFLLTGFLFSSVTELHSDSQLVLFYNSIYTCIQSITFRVCVYMHIVYVYGLDSDVRIYSRDIYTHIHSQHVNKQKGKFCIVRTVGACRRDLSEWNKTESSRGSSHPFSSKEKRKRKKGLDKAPQTFDRSNHQKSLEPWQRGLIFSKKKKFVKQKKKKKKNKKTPGS